MLLKLSNDNIKEIFVKKETLYFWNVDVPDAIVRKRPELFELEYISKKNPVWQKTSPNSSYEREFYFGEGNGCLFDITYEEARSRLAEWGVEI